MEGMTTSTEARRLGLLALQRLAFLRPAEKLSLRDLLDGGASLALLSLSDIESAIHRCLGDREYRPQGLLEAARRDAELLEGLGARFVALGEAGYPAALAEIPEPPFGLYLRGMDLPAEAPAVAVVGTRHPTGAGVEEALRLSGELSSAGLPVVSGLALGIDAAAHRGAIASGGFTCAVLPCGVESVYPAGNRGLAARILEAGGLLASEYPPGTEIRKSRFPERNRIISGLCRGLLVVEAPSGSGALITADFALEQGRDVFVDASRLGGAQSCGLDRLAADGARPVSSAAEVIAEWGLKPLGYGRAFQYIEGESHESSIEGRSLAAALRAELGRPFGQAAHEAMDSRGA
jgi:DNA processing protein